MRDEGDDILKSMGETFETSAAALARRHRLAPQMLRPRNFGRMKEDAAQDSAKR